MAEGPEMILECFKKFDADASGAISLEELREVLKALDQWNEEEVEQLMAQADASGDGQLQLREFVSWLFADDPTFAGAGDFTVSISGCSRDHLNGDYVREKGRVYGGRPVFYCAANKKLLFYFEKGKGWHIFHKTGRTASCRLCTERAPHTPLDAKWLVWQPKDKEFVEESEMVCKMLVPDRREEIAKAPQLLRPVQGEVYGTYAKRLPLMVGGRPLYFCGADDTFLIYVEKKMKWTVCKMKPKDPDGASDGPVVALRENMERDEVGFSVSKIPKYMQTDKRAVDDTNTEETDWKFITRLGLGYCFPIGRSEVTTAYSPERATWHHPEEEYLLEWEAVDPTPTKGDPEAGWMDPDFPPDNFSLGDPAGTGMEAEWIRAVHLCEDPVLFGEHEEPADALQGSLGNCAMIASMAALAEYPGYLSSLFVTKDIPADGKYKIRMFLPIGFEHNKTEKHWGEVEIDDYLPCSPPAEEGVLASAKPKFAKLANGNKLYMALLEKAFAKASGNYLGMEGYDGRVVWKALTGCEESFCFTDMRPRSEKPRNYYLEPEWEVTAAEGVAVSEKYGGLGELGRLMPGATFQEVQRNKRHVQFTKLSGEGPEKGWLPYYVAGQRTASRKSKRWWQLYSNRPYPEVEMFQKLVELDKAKNPMTTGPIRRPGMGSEGLCFPHAYTIVRAVEVEGFKMVCTRNPWGHGEWKGPWCDGGEEWTAHPEVAEALQVEDKDNGRFWMEFEDWEWSMGTVTGMYFSVPAERAP